MPVATPTKFTATPLTEVTSLVASLAADQMNCKTTELVVILLTEPKPWVVDQMNFVD